MRFLHGKSEPERTLASVGDKAGHLAEGRGRSGLIKAGLIAGGAIALTAGSAAISSLRRRIGESDS